MEQQHGQCKRKLIFCILAPVLTRIFPSLIGEWKYQIKTRQKKKKKPPKVLEEEEGEENTKKVQSNMWVLRNPDGVYEL